MAVKQQRETPGLWRPRYKEKVVLPKGTPVYLNYPVWPWKEMRPVAAAQPHHLSGRTYVVQVHNVVLEDDEDGVLKAVWVSWRSGRDTYRWADAAHLKPLPTDLEALADVMKYWRS